MDEEKKGAVDPDGDVAVAKASPRCEVCQQVSPKYRCPRCMMRTCSLPCVKKHKADGACSGTRDKTGYVKVKQFTDRHLLSDYRFLEEVVRATESAGRGQTQCAGRNLPRHLKQLVSQAWKRGIELCLLPRLFTKHVNNSSRYIYASGEILWRVEWIFPQADVKHPTREKEDTILGEALSNIYESDSIMRHALRGYVGCGAEGVQLLMKKEQCKANQPRYYLLDPAKSIRENLQGKVIIEYPGIHAVFRDKCSSYQLVDTPDTREGTDISKSDQNLGPADRSNLHRPSEQSTLSGPVESSPPGPADQSSPNGPVDQSTTRGSLAVSPSMLDH